MRITPKNWGDFQHYKDRDPPWIKLHKKLLDDFEFQGLPVASRALAPMLWLLASEDKDGVINANEAKLAFRFRMSVGELTDALMPLIQSKFFSVERDDSEVIAPRKHDAMPETETQGQTETQVKAEAETAQALTAYNRVAEELDWPKAVRLTASRLTGLKARLAECGGIEGWNAAMTRARASPFLRGEEGRDAAHAGWCPDLDFFLAQKSFTKLMEGKYDQRSSNQRPTGVDAMLEGLRGAAGMDEGRGPGMENPRSPPLRIASTAGG